MDTNTSLLAIDNMLAGTAGRGPATSKPPAAQGSHFAMHRKMESPEDTGQSSPIPADNSPSSNSPETTKTDNTVINAPNEPTNKPPQEFSHTLRKKITTEVSQQAEDGRKPEKQSPIPSVAEQPNAVQLWLAQYSLTVEHGKEGVATKIVIKPKAGLELAQLLANLKAEKFPPGAGQTANSATTKPTKLTSLTHKTENNPFLTIDRSQTGIKAVLPNGSKAPIVADTEQGTGKNADKTPILNKTVTGTKDFTICEGGQKLMTVAVSTSSKTTAAGEKSAIADKPAVSDGQETPALNTGFPAAQGKSSDPQSQLVGVGPEKSATVAEEPTDNKAIAGQILSESADGNGKESRPGGNNLSGDSLLQKLNVTEFQVSTSADGNGKESRPGGNNLSGDSLLQKLNVTEFQVSTGQTKDHSSSTFNNSSDADSDFARPLPHNNAQPPITELFSDGSAQAAKATNNTSPGGVSAGVSEQILESIHGSLSRQAGIKQITIRLNPPELGKVFIKFQEQGDQITGLLRVSKAQTRYEIEQALPQIIQNLQDSGIQIKRLEVVLTSQQEQHAFKDPSLAAEQDGWSGEQAGAEGNNPNPDAIGTDEWLTNDSSYQDITEEPQEMVVTNNSINMLM